MGRDLSLERAWRKRMRQQERSGLTIRQFCQQERLVDHQFSWWRRCTHGPSSTRQVGLADYRDRLLILVFCPRDFSLVCATELTALSGGTEEFRRAAAIREAAHKFCCLLSEFSATTSDRAGILEDIAARGSLNEALPKLQELETMATKFVQLASGLSLEDL